MAVVAHVILNRGVSPEQYDAVRAEAGWLENPPDGGYSHVAWWEGDDNHNVDAWESEEAFQAFGENRLGPAMAKLEINVPRGHVSPRARGVQPPGGEVDLTHRPNS